MRPCTARRAAARAAQAGGAPLALNKRGCTALQTCVRESRVTRQPHARSCTLLLLRLAAQPCTPTQAAAGCARARAPRFPAAQRPLKFGGAKRLCLTEPDQCTRGRRQRQAAQGRPSRTSRQAQAHPIRGAAGEPARRMSLTWLFFALSLSRSSREVPISTPGTLPRFQTASLEAPPAVPRAVNTSFRRSARVVDSKALINREQTTCSGWTVSAGGRSARVPPATGLQRLAAQAAAAGAG